MYQQPGQNENALRFPSQSENDLASSFWYIKRIAMTMQFMQALVNELVRLYRKCGERVPEELDHYTTLQP
jgi:hypothetical protein